MLLEMVGGVVLDKLTNFSLTECDFIENESETFGGGLHVESTVSHLLISACSFIRNVATNGAGEFNKCIYIAILHLWCCRNYVIYQQRQHYCFQHDV